MHLPRKRFGQHFLSDQYYIAKIVEALNPTAIDNLVEIGPGQGALTVHVMKETHKLQVIELDRDLIPELTRRTQHYGELVIYNEDALQFDFAKLAKSKQKIRVFGNLPYNISTPLLFHLLDQVNLFKDMLFMLQKEVAHRLAAKVNTKEYGRLSVMVQYYCDVERLFDVPPSAFFPPPQVTSSIVRLNPLPKRSLTREEEHLFSDLVRHAFMHRRKTIRNSLKPLVADADWAALNMHSDLRAENLTPQDFINLTQILKK